MARRYTRTRKVAPDSRSASARAAGLGTSETGVHHWWAQRASAVALIPLTLWFVASLIVHASGDYATTTAWVRSLPVATLLILLQGVLFYHTALGLQVIVEDYVHSPLKFAAIMVVRFGCLALTVIGVVAVLYIALAS
ncbi:MAG: succinate dehydrogenase, hydrophobic membrane anchor protein [Devosia sp.]